MKNSFNTLGQDTIYICTSCGAKEKQFALKSRFYTFCRKCSGYSVKSTLLDTLNFVEQGRQEPENFEFLEEESL